MFKKLMKKPLFNKKKAMCEEKEKAEGSKEVVDSYDPKKPSQYDNKLRCQADRSTMGRW